jgi:hypothetical protein
MEGHGIQNDVVDLIQPNDQALRVVAIGKDVDFARYLVGPEYSGFTVESVCLLGDRSKIIESGDF